MLKYGLNVYILPYSFDAKKERDVISQAWIWADCLGKKPMLFFYVLQLNTFDMEILKKIDSILPFYKVIFQGSIGGSTLNFCSNINQMGQVQIIF